MELGYDWFGAKAMENVGSGRKAANETQAVRAAYFSRESCCNSEH